jgi:hypothetical protein
MSCEPVIVIYCLNCADLALNANSLRPVGAQVVGIDLKWDVFIYFYVNSFIWFFTSDLEQTACFHLTSEEILIPEKVSVSSQIGSFRNILCLNHFAYQRLTINAKRL